MNRLRHLAELLFILGTVAGGAGLSAGPADYFRIEVVDDETGRGVPLAQLRTVNHASWWTDSRGLIAFHEPGLDGQEVFFHVFSHGYEYPKDGFGNRGLKLKPVPGGRVTIKLKRLNVAERLYRITGQGIYRDSLLLGDRPPLRRPALDGQVMGQDTVISTPYRGQIYWFWGDTERVSYPLGNFGASGAVSDWPSRGGLEPGVGVDLNYFTDASGFSKPMCPDFGPGLQWIEGVVTVPDASGRERLVARVSSQKGLAPAYAWHLAVFNDQKQIFESKVRWEINEGHDSAHPFRARVDGVEYIYFYPNYRVPARLEALEQLNRYEAYTCVAGDGKIHDGTTEIDRDANGNVRYSWKAGADRLYPGRIQELVKQGRIQAGEAWIQLRDIETGRAINAGRGSVFWNEFRQRWIQLVSAQAGEVWFAEGDTTVGPWVYARRVVAHDNYNFYNPTQHPFFDRERGRVIHFEGTYTASFSGAKEKTPRYDYNQILYRLTLEDARLDLPAPVYRVRAHGGGPELVQREAIAAARAWESVEGIEFFAVPAARTRPGLVPVFPDPQHRLRVGAAAAAGQAANAQPVFLALPVEPGSADRSTDVVPLYEFHREKDGRCLYSTEAAWSGENENEKVVRSPAPLCRVWRNPMRAVIIDPAPVPVPVQPAAP